MEYECAESTPNSSQFVPRPRSTLSMKRSQHSEKSTPQRPAPYPLSGQTSPQDTNEICWKSCETGGGQNSEREPVFMRGGRNVSSSTSATTYFEELSGKNINGPLSLNSVSISPLYSNTSSTADSVFSPIHEEQVVSDSIVHPSYACVAACQNSEEKLCSVDVGKRRVRSQSPSIKTSPHIFNLHVSGESSDERNDRLENSLVFSSIEENASLEGILEQQRFVDKSDNLKTTDSLPSLDCSLRFLESGQSVQVTGSGREKDRKESKEGKSSEKDKKTRKAWYNVLNPTYKSRSEDLKRLFKDLPSDERLIVDYSCALQKDILVHGRLYITQNFFCFYSKIFGWETFLNIKCSEIFSITKEKTALVIPNALQISTQTDKHFFTSFAARDKTYLMLFRIWQNALIGQQVSPTELWQWVHSSYGDELGLTSDDDDYVAPSTEDDVRSSFGGHHSASSNFPSMMLTKTQSIDSNEPPWRWYFHLQLGLEQCEHALWPGGRVVTLSAFRIREQWIQRSNLAKGGYFPIDSASMALVYDVRSFSRTQLLSVWRMPGILCQNGESLPVLSPLILRDPMDPEKECPDRRGRGSTPIHVPDYVSPLGAAEVDEGGGARPRLDLPMPNRDRRASFEQLLSSISASVSPKPNSAPSSTTAEGPSLHLALRSALTICALPSVQVTQDASQADSNQEEVLRSETRSADETKLEASVTDGGKSPRSRTGSHHFPLHHPPPSPPSEIYESESDVKALGHATDVVDCPNKKSHHHGNEMLDVIYELPIDKVFILLFTNSKFMLDLLTTRKTYDVMASEWQSNPETHQKIRQVTYTVSLPTVSLGPKVSHVTETQVMSSFSKSREIYTIDAEACNSGIPYADYFFVSTHWCLTRVGVNRTRLSVWSEVKYKKSVWGFMKSVIDRNSYDGVRNLMNDLNVALLQEADSVRSRRKRRRGGSKTIEALDPNLPQFDNMKDFHSAAITNRRITALSLTGGTEGPKHKTPFGVAAIFLTLLLVVNAFLYYRLYALEERVIKGASFRHFGIDKRVDGVSMDEWVVILQEQEALHSAEVDRWRTAIVEAADHLKKAEESLRNLHSSIPQNQASKLQALLRHLQVVQETQNQNRNPSHRSSDTESENIHTGEL